MKIFNKRPIVLFAVVMLITTLVLLYVNISFVKYILLGIFALALVVGLILWLVLKKKVCKYVFSRMFIVSLAVLISISGVVIHEKLYNRDYDEYEGYATLSARISDVGEYYNTNYRQIVVDNVYFETDEFCKELKGNALFVVVCDKGSEDVLVVGNKIVSNCKISFSELYYKGDYGLTFKHAIENITCSGYVMESDIEVLDGNKELKLSDIVKNKVEEIVNGSLDKEYAGLALGMLFGNKQELSDEVSSDFSATGIAHLLAVSGLHVGFLLTILLWVCKLFKVRGVAKFLVVSALLIFYAYLCGFSVSVVRATIMSICALYASCRFKHYDSLNALAISLIIVILVAPFSITTVGFMLSYMAVLAILLLAKPLTRILSKIFKEKMANTIATMLAAQIGTTGVIVTAFENVTLVGVVANFVSIPIASLAYMVLFVTVCISLILPFASIIVYFFEVIMQVVVKFVHLLAGVNMLPLAKWQGSVVSYCTIAAMAMTSDYVFVRKIVKLICAVVFWINILVILAL